MIGQQITSINNSRNKTA